MSSTAIAVPPLFAQSFWQRLREHALPLGAISVIFVMMVPLPAAALDLLLAVSMAASIVVFLSAVQIRRAVELSVFPTLLLLLTPPPPPPLLIAPLPPPGDATWYGVTVFGYLSSRWKRP